MTSATGFSPFTRRRIRWGVGLALAALLFLSFKFVTYRIFGLTLDRSGFVHDSVLNKRGDRLSFDAYETANRPFISVVALRRTRHYDPKILVSVTSSKLSFRLKWLDDDHAEVVLHADKSGKMATAVASVGPIYIVYSFKKDLN